MFCFGCLCYWCMTFQFVPSLAWAKKKHSNFSATISLSQNKLRLRKVNKQ